MLSTGVHCKKGWFFDKYRNRYGQTGQWFYAGTVIGLTTLGRQVRIVAVPLGSLFGVDRTLNGQPFSIDHTLVARSHRKGRTITSGSPLNVKAWRWQHDKHPN